MAAAPPPPGATRRPTRIRVWSTTRC